MKKNIKEIILKSNFLRDWYIFALVLLSLLFIVAFYMLVKKHFGGSEILNLSSFGVGYEFLPQSENWLDIVKFLTGISLFNIILAKLFYEYDLLVAYILITSIAILNVIYCFSALLFLSVL